MPLLDSRSFRSEKQAVRLEVLDGARGFAVMLVILDHASDSGLLLHPLLNFNRAGYIGVLLFFALSAFLLSYLFLRRDLPVGSVTVWLNYGLRRVLRIYPLYLSALCFHAWNSEKFDAHDVVNHLLLLDGQRHFWTIAVECKFYLILPLAVIAMVLLRRGERIAGGAVVVGTTLALWALGALEKSYSVTNDIWLSEYLKVFFGGIAAGGFFAWWVRGGREVPSWLQAAFSACALLCVLVALARVPAFYNPLFSADAPVKRLPSANSLFAIIWPFFLVSLLMAGSIVQSLFTILPLRFLGWVSFSAYLWHPFLRAPFESLAVASPVRLMLYVVGVISVSTVSYLLIERPLLKVRFGRH